MAAWLKRSDGSKTPLGKTDLILGKEKFDGPITVLDPKSNSQYRYATISPRTTKYGIIDLGKNSDGVFLSHDQLTPHVTYWLTSGDQIQIGTKLFTYKDDAAGVRLERDGKPTRFLKTPEYTIGPAPEASNHIHIENGSGADPYVKICQHPTGQSYAVIDLGYGTLVNYQQLKNYKQRPWLLNTGDKLLIGKTSGDDGTVFSYEEDSTPSSGKPSSSFAIGSFIVGLVVAFIMIGLGNYFFQSQPAPDKTLSAFCGAIKNGDYQTAYDQLSTHAQKQVTEQHFASTLAQSFTKQGGFEDCTTFNVQLGDTTARGTLTVVFKNDQIVNYSDSLVKEGDNWKIDSSNPKLVMQVQSVCCTSVRPAIEVGHKEMT